MSTSDYDLLLPVESPRESGAISLASLGVSPFLQTLGARRVAFGSNVERLMFPLHSAPTHLGIEQGLIVLSHT